MENVTKSIIYGNTYQNKYGKFLPICSSILDRASISSILDYLTQSVHFRKFNRVAYAYRVDEMPVVFITEKKNTETEYYEGHHSDETIQGSGQKLLHLLQKFNIRNVLIAVLVEQFNPLLPFEAINYRAIVENSRILLDELYKRVIQFQDQHVHGPNDLLLSSEKILKTKKVEIGSELPLPNQKNELPKDRPNYVYGNKNASKPSFSEKKVIRSSNRGLEQEMRFLWDRCQSMKEQFQKITQNLQVKELQQLRYFIMYDKSPIINMVVQLFLIYLGASKQNTVESFDFSILKDANLQPLSKDKVRKLDQVLKTNKKLTVDSVIKINRGLGMLFSMMEIRIRFTKCLERLTQLMEKSQSRNNGPRGGNDEKYESELTRTVKIDSL